MNHPFPDRTSFWQSQSGREVGYFLLTNLLIAAVLVAGIVFVALASHHVPTPTLVLTSIVILVGLPIYQLISLLVYTLLAAQLAILVETSDQDMTIRLAGTLLAWFFNSLLSWLLLSYLLSQPLAEVGFSFLIGFITALGVFGGVLATHDHFYPDPSPLPVLPEHVINLRRPFKVILTHRYGRRTPSRRRPKP